MILCCRDDCGCSPRSPGHEPEGQQSRNEERNGQLPEARGDKARCLFAGRTWPLRGRGYSPRLPGSMWAYGYWWELLELLANTAGSVQDYITISRPSSHLRVEKWMFQSGSLDRFWPPSKCCGKLTCRTPAFWSYPSHVDSDASQRLGVCASRRPLSRSSSWCGHCTVHRLPRPFTCPGSWSAFQPAQQSELQQMPWVKETRHPAGLPLLPPKHGCSQAIPKPTLPKH